MKRLLRCAAVLCFGLAVTIPAAAQENDAAKAIIDRYEQATGLGKLAPDDMNSLMADVVIEMQEMTMPMKMIVKQPDKWRIEMEINGQKMLMVARDGKGWISVAGQGVQPMPKETMAQLKEQMASITRNYKWSSMDFDYELADEVREGGKMLQGVHMVPKKTQPAAAVNLIVYFDQASGLVDHCTVDVVQGTRTMAARMDFGEYKTFGQVKLPAKYKMTMAGGSVVMMDMEIKALEYNYPAADELFAKPE